MAKSNGWYEVRAERIDSEGKAHRGWIVRSNVDGTFFFWHQTLRNEAAPVCGRFASFAEAEKAAEWGTSFTWYVVHFPVRRDSNGRKRPLLKGDAVIVQSS